MKKTKVHLLLTEGMITISSDTINERLSISAPNMHELFPFYFQFATTFSLRQIIKPYYINYGFTFELMFSKN